MGSRAPAIVLLVIAASGAPRAQDEASAAPNVVYMLADDLGYGELGCYGQRKIRTPNIDSLAADGMRFTRHYSGAPVCAPSRCVLMTGRHLAHAEIRGNKPVRPEGQWPISAGLVTLAEVFRSAGYATGAFGKWGLGPVGSSGDPNTQGFDVFFGYNCQRVAHSYYPPHLWRNDEQVPLNDPAVPGHYRAKDDEQIDFSVFIGRAYAPDRMLEEAIAFVRAHRDERFFLYLPFIQPHVAMQPKQEFVDRYPDEWDTEPYRGNRGYVPHPRPRAGYAAMISELDAQVGAILATLDELELTRRTLVMFSSDNGPTHDVGGVDTEFFDSAGGLRGRKGSVYEGGLRVPMLARWPGRIAAGTVTEHVSAFQDVMPTVCELLGVDVPDGCDGVSFLPALLGREPQPEHEFLVWEFPEYGGQQAVLLGSFKGVRRDLQKRVTDWQLYDLATDPDESEDVAAKHPEIVERIDAIMRGERVPNAEFPLRALDG
jgi:arylsulfatase A-like enzyme